MEPFFLFFRNDLGKLKYVLLCIKESNRLYSVVPQISRVLEKPYEIDGKMADEGKLLVHFNDYLYYHAEFSIGVMFHKNLLETL